jgi:hypothetical protein
MIDVLLIIGYLFICATAFFGHLVTLYVKIKNGEKWTSQDSNGYNRAQHLYKFSFYENILGWGAASLVPIFNICMIIYDIVYLINPFIKRFDKFVNNLLGAKSGD